MVLDQSLAAFFRRGARVTLRDPKQAWRFLRVARWQTAAAKQRGRWRHLGLQVPPIIIFSITDTCDLQCIGCYAKAFHGDEGAASGELSDARMQGVVGEAAALGVSFFVIAGGEPLMRPSILTIAERFPRVLFLLLTNGMSLDEATVAHVARLGNLIPLLSLEGTAVETDARRGKGTHARLEEAMRRLKAAGVFFGCSVTLTSGNLETVLDDLFVSDLVERGVRFFLMLDYTPADATTTDWVLTERQRALVGARLDGLRHHRALFVAVPWDELQVGGCLAAGRGFVHVNAKGDLQPCPFAPFSDASVAGTPLSEALRSPFLASLRQRPELTKYEGGGCALWKNRQEVEELLGAVTAKEAPER